MSPKSLLRHKQAISDLSELSQGGFRTVIDEVDPLDKNAVKRVVLCGGKVYYDLLDKRRDEDLKDVAIVRIEQLYPYPAARVNEVLAQYPNATELVWAQEEPQNQGAWLFLAPYIYAELGSFTGRLKVSYAGRPASAAPACGSPYLHAKQQATLVVDALGINNERQGEA
jgi:2-oxoglutarate dehydrogenase E1 component